jgi:7-cyano-7-deazaguanine synthase
MGKMSDIKLGSEFYRKQTEGGKALVKVLWTGGFDSTYRIAELSRHDVIIQPYYLSDRKRRSENFELLAIRDITADIERNPETMCRILPLIIKKVSELKPDKEIVEAYERLRSSLYIGPQYVWLAQFAKSNTGLELCIEMLSSQSGATFCISQHGKLREVNDRGLIYRVLDQDSSNMDLITIFGSMHFL